MKQSILLLAMAAALTLSCGSPLSPQDKLTVNDKKIDAIIARMTLEEKVNMLHSKTNMSSAGVERLGIADMHYADGPFGIREEGQPNGFMSAGWTLDSATFFPKPVSKYTERFYVGYRWFDTKEIKPMYAFGHGLSYVEFAYGAMKARAGKDAVRVSFELKNEGAMPVDEVVQLYVHRVDSAVEWPVKELKAFKRVSLGAGESKKVSLEIPLRDLRYWDEASAAWALEKGRLELLLGASSDDIRQTAEVTI